MILDCPHCHTRVSLMADSICPACRKDTSDTKGTNPDQVSMTIWEAEKLPSNCLACNSPTERHVDISEKTEIGGDGPGFKVLLAVLAIVTLRPGMIRLRAAGSVHTINLRIPQCDHCAPAGKPKPTYIEWKQASATFIVHKGFRAGVLQERARND